MKHLLLEQDNFNAKFTAFIIFLYPIAGIGLKHWFSGFATLLIFSGFYVLVSNFRNKANSFSDYSSDEKYLLFFVASIFFVFVISGFVNGWNDNQLRYFSREMNFLFFVPLYIAVRKVKNAPEILIKATVIAGIIFVFSYIYDVHISTVPYSKNLGAYGHLVTGPVASMFLFITLASYKYLFVEKKWAVLFFLSISIAFLTAAATKSGTAYVVMVVMSLIIPVFIAQKWLIRLIIYIVFLLILLTAYNNSNYVKKATLRVTSGIQTTIGINDLRTNKGELGVASARISMWVVSWDIFKENPFFGVGRGNYTDHAKKIVEKGLANEGVALHSHPHNIYFELLVSKGVVGFTVFMLLLFFIFKTYNSARKNKLDYNSTAFIHILCILLIGIGSEGPLIKNNFTTLFLVYLAVFYSSFSQQLNKKEEVST